MPFMKMRSIARLDLIDSIIGYNFTLDTGWRTSQPWTFQPQTLTPDCSTLDFSTMNFSTSWFKNSWLKSLGSKSLGLKGSTGLKSPGLRCPSTWQKTCNSWRIPYKRNYWKSLLLYSEWFHLEQNDLNYCFLISVCKTSIYYKLESALQKAWLLSKVHTYLFYSQ